MELLETLEAVDDDVRTDNQLIHSNREFNEHDYEMLLSLDENNHIHLGASAAQIANLPESTMQSDDTEVCSVCLETPVIGDTMRHLRCLHKFHKDCFEISSVYRFITIFSVSECFRGKCGRRLQRLANSSWSSIQITKIVDGVTVTRPRGFAVLYKKSYITGSKVSGASSIFKTRDLSVLVKMVEQNVVMRYMMEIITHSNFKGCLHELFKELRPYSEEEINEVRDLWANYVLNN